MPNEYGDIPPHPLDSAFSDCTSRKRVEKGLENNQCFEAALEAAVQAFETASNRPHGMMGPRPDKAARVAFLNALNATGGTGSAGK